MTEERDEGQGEASEGQHVAEAIEEAVQAADRLSQSNILVADAQHAHARLRKGDRAKSWTAVLTALAALIAAVGAFLKTLDHGVTESAYNTLSESIVKLSDQERQTAQDVAMLRGYLDGLSRAPMPAGPATGTGLATVPTSATATVILSPIPGPIDAGVTAFVRDAGHPHTSPPPAVAPPAPPVRPPSFAAATAK